MVKLEGKIVHYHPRKDNGLVEVYDTDFCTVIPFGPEDLKMSFDEGKDNSEIKEKVEDTEVEFELLVFESPETGEAEVNAKRITPI